MKILICLFLTLGVFANEKLELLKQLEEVNKVQQVADKAKAKLDATEDKTLFQTAVDDFKKAKLRAIAANIMEYLANKGKGEAKCLVKIRERLDALSIPYLESDSCQSLKALCKENVICSSVD